MRDNGRGSPAAPDAYAPAAMALRAAEAGTTKARRDGVSLFTLAVLAGAFIGLGAQLATLVSVAPGLPFGPARLLTGVAFSLGLILVVIAGAELFTGNTLIVIARLTGVITTRALLRNWAIAYVGNFAGAVGTAALVALTGPWALADGEVARTALALAQAKLSLDPLEALVRGILGNALVCLAVWLCFSARSTTDRILSIIPPVTAFVAAGFEHSVANMYVVPLAMALLENPSAREATALLPGVASLTWGRFFASNLLPVTIGNIIGGSVMVGTIYWLVYLRARRR